MGLYRSEKHKIHGLSEENVEKLGLFVFNLSIDCVVPERKKSCDKMHDNSAELRLHQMGFFSKERQ